MNCLKMRNLVKKKFEYDFWKLKLEIREIFDKEIFYFKNGYYKKPLDLQEAMQAFDLEISSKYINRKLLYESRGLK